MIKKIKKIKTKEDREYKYIPEGDLRKICLPIEKIIPLKNNPRNNEKTIKELIKVIKDIGFRRPIVLNENYEIKAGNTAYKAALKLKMKFVPAVRTSFKDESEEWKCVLSDNKIGEKSEWNMNVLKKLMDSGKVIPETKHTGFTERELINIQNLKSSCASSGSSPVNIKNRFLGMLLNNLTKYEQKHNLINNGFPANVNNKSSYLIEENDKIMAVFYYEMGKKQGKKSKKVVKSSKKVVKNNKKSNKKLKK